MKPSRRFWIDVGGTFTDCLLAEGNGNLHTCKVLSSGVIKGTLRPSPESSRHVLSDLPPYPDGFFAGYRLHAVHQNGTFESLIRNSWDEGGVRLELRDDLPDSVRPETRFDLTSGEPAPVVGMRILLGLGLNDPLGDVELRLGTTRATNALLERKGARTAWITTAGFEDVLEIANQDRPDLFDLNIQKPRPLYEYALGISERISARGDVLDPLDSEGLQIGLKRLQEEGIQSLAVGLLHAYLNPAHEEKVAEMARAAGFRDISLSSSVSPTIKIVPRGDTTVVDAYLTPVVREYFERIASCIPEGRIRVMTSAGSLAGASAVGGKDLVLSGPAGGVVGLAGAAREAGIEKAVGFDMGGTSTDVSRYDGEFDYEFETSKAGVRIVAPMLAIETVAAGGGSICDYDGQKLTVGPDSAGAEPGPACYGRGGPLAVTDLNVFLGRIRSADFPFSLDRDAVAERLAELGRKIQDAGGPALDLRQLAEGYLRIANAHMAGAIKKISIARGYDIRDYGLVSFGGAAGQHACAVARELGIRTILVHPQASVLSAYGMGAAEISRFSVRPVLEELHQATLHRVRDLLKTMESEACDELAKEEPDYAGPINIERTLEVRYRGQNTTLNVPEDSLASIREAFEHLHIQRYGHAFRGRPLEIVNARLKASFSESRSFTSTREEARYDPVAKESSRVTFKGEEQEVPVFRVADLEPGAELSGPALLVEPNSTLVLDPGWRGRLTGRGHLIFEEQIQRERETRGELSSNPIDLEIFNNHFRSIAEQMGATLRRTALSVNVKERLDFSCAIFTAAGDLVANAPHVPVHLGAMSECVKWMLKDTPELGPGDVMVTNDPLRGGSHLPDVTVMTPVFDKASGNLIFLTASRAHHAEIGGIRPGSMPPDSTNLAQEGVVIRNFKIVRTGNERMSEFRKLLTESPYPSRSPDDNLADVSAQIAANQSGVAALLAMIDRFGRERTLAYMSHIQEAAEAKMRACLRRLGDGVYPFEDALDDGSPLRVLITIRDGAVTLDFSGSAPVHAGNLNANRAIVSAAVIYCFRCLIGEDIPLNAGVLEPVKLILPEGILNPPVNPDPQKCPAVVGGNVETSQRIVDVIFGALGVVAASQGTMNNLTFGNERFGYYETLCGGAGAGEGFAGCDAVHTHMTNTRLTDPEVFERQYPVRVKRFRIRDASGGAGLYPGGNGVIRDIEFLAPISVSLLTQRRKTQPYGLKGGSPGAAGRNTRITKGPQGEQDAQSLGPVAQFEAQPGDRLVIETPGGGGYGTAQD